MSRSIFYPSVFNPPGAFTTTINVPRGGECFAPATTRSPTRQQPPGLTDVPGAFTTSPPPPNTTFGGEAFYPAATRRLAPQQPQGEVLPPGKFTTTAILNTTFGGETFYPATTRRLIPRQPQGEVLPPGAFRTQIGPPTPVTGDRRLYPFVEPSSKPVETKDLLRRITQKLSALINDLFLKGYIVQDGNNSWVLLPAVFRMPRTPGPGDDVTQGAYPGIFWIDTTTNDVYMNVDNTAGAAVWKKVS